MIKGAIDIDLLFFFYFVAHKAVCLDQKFYSVLIVCSCNPCSKNILVHDKGQDTVTEPVYFFYS